MKALSTIAGIAREIITELFRASLDVVSVDNIGGAPETYTYGGGNNQ